MWSGVTMNDARDEPAFPFVDDHLVQPSTRYDEALAETELTRVMMPYGGTAWLATRMDDVRQVLSDTRFTRTTFPDMPRYTPEALPANSVLVGLDPPEHTRIRRLVGKALTVQLMNGMQPWVRDTVDTILAELVEQGPPVDLATQFGDRLPRLAVCRLLGMPYRDHDRFDGWVDAVFSMMSRPRDEIGRAWTNLSAYIGELVERRRTQPEDDLVTALVNVRNGDDRLSDLEVITNAAAVLVAGYESTATMITTAAYILMTQPGLRSSLLEDESRVSDAVEELLRYIPLGTGAMTSHAAEDIAVGGTTVRRGESVIPCLAAANYDGSVFDDARSFDIDRKTKGKHITFGYGPHFCMGARLARIEIHEAVIGMLRHMPNMRLAVDEAKLPRKPWLGIRGFVHLPVSW
jgi:cytochrome P450